MSTSNYWAETYRNHGYVVIPVSPGTKKAMVKWKQFQETTPTHDEWEKMWRGMGGANVGVVCGKAGRVVVVDADSPDAVRFCRLHMGFTPMRVKTSKGMHFYFRHPGHQVITRVDVHSQYPIDIRGDRGMANGAGSTHKSGIVYSLDDGADFVSVRDLPRYEPDWFPEPQRFARSAPTTRAISLDAQGVRAYLDRVPGSGSGSRSNDTYRVAARVVRDFAVDPDLAVELLAEWNTKNDPPLDFSELRDIVMSAFQHGRHPLGCRLEGRLR